MATKEIDFRDESFEDGFDAGLLDTIEQGTAETFDTQYKTIQWANGDAKNKRDKDIRGQGGWFFPSKITFDDADMLANGWVNETLVHSGNDETPGYYKRELTIIPIILREAWAVRKDGENVGLVGFDNSGRYGDFAAFRKAKWEGYEKAKDYGNPAVRLQVLCLIAGMEDFGPVALTLGGSVARAFYDERGADTVLGDLHRSVISAANAKSDEVVRKQAAEAGSEAERREIMKRLGRHWAMRAFRVTVGADRNAEGAPVYTTVGKAPSTTDVTLPRAMGLPAKGEPVDINNWFVGKSKLATVNELFEEAKHTWAVAWDTLVPTAAVADEPVVAAVSTAAAARHGF